MPNIKEFRENNNLKQKDVGLVLGVTKSTVSGWENGHDIIPLKRLITFCNYYKLSIDYLIGKSTDNNYLELEIDKDKLCKLLLEARKKNNKTQEQVSKMLNISTGTYCDYENGNHLISTTSLIALTELYDDFSLDELFRK